MSKQTFKLGEDWLTAGKALEITENKISVILSNETE
jgi:histidine ammonia-lyase